MIIVARFQSNNFDIIIASYFLSPAGRSYFRSINKSTIIFSTIDSQFFHYPNLIQEEHDIPVTKNDDDLQISKNVRSFLEDVAIKSESESIDIFTTDPLMDSNEASDIYLSFKESLENLQQMNFEDILHINLFKNIHIITEQVLNSLAISLELDDIEQFQKIIHYFLDHWAFGISEDLPFWLYLQELPPVELWKRIVSIDDWKTFATLVLRIVSIGTSESNCERLISKQKHTTGDYGTNYGCKTMQARLGIKTARNLIEMVNYEKT